MNQKVLMILTVLILNIFDKLQLTSVQWFEK